MTANPILRTLKLHECLGGERSAPFQLRVERKYALAQPQLRYLHSTSAYAGRIDPSTNPGRPHSVGSSIQGTRVHPGRASRNFLIDTLLGTDVQLPNF
jgi:hypothetical protein